MPGGGLGGAGGGGGIKAHLLDDGLEVVPLPRLKSGRRVDGMIARHLVAGEKGVGRFVVRDADARICSRGRFAVEVREG